MDTYTVSEDVKITLNGKQFLLEAGDQIIVEGMISSMINFVKGLMTDVKNAMNKPEPQNIGNAMKQLNQALKKDPKDKQMQQAKKGLAEKTIQFYAEQIINNPKLSGKIIKSLESVLENEDFEFLRNAIKKFVENKGTEEGTEGTEEGTEGTEEGTEGTEKGTEEGTGENIAEGYIMDMNVFVVSEDTEVVLNGKKFLLEKGDKIVLEARPGFKNPTQGAIPTTSGKEEKSKISDEDNKTSAQGGRLAAYISKCKKTDKSMTINGILEVLGLTKKEEIVPTLNRIASTPAYSKFSKLADKIKEKLSAPKTKAEPAKAEAEAEA